MIGLITNKEESFARFQHDFGWQMKNEADSQCLKNKLQWDWSLKHPHDPVNEGSDTWKLIAVHYQYDVELCKISV